MTPALTRALNPRLDPCFFAIFDRTDLRISLSGALPKFNEGAVFDVYSAVGPPKPHPIDENLTFRSEIFAEKKKIGVEKSKVANPPKRALPRFRADRSQVRGVNRRSKFAVAAVRRKMRRHLTRPSMPPSLQKFGPISFKIYQKFEKVISEAQKKSDFIFSFF